jgi:hypothetical protein
MPGVGFDGDVVFEQGAGFNATIESLFQWRLLALSRRSIVAAEELVSDWGQNRQTLDRPGKPQR